MAPNRPRGIQTDRLTVDDDEMDFRFRGYYLVKNIERDKDFEELHYSVETEDYGQFMLKLLLNIKKNRRFGWFRIFMVDYGFSFLMRKFNFYINGLHNGRDVYEIGLMSEGSKFFQTRLFTGYGPDYGSLLGGKRGRDNLKGLKLGYHTLLDCVKRVSDHLAEPYQWGKSIAIFAMTFAEPGRFRWSKEDLTTTMEKHEDITLVHGFEYMAILPKDWSPISFAARYAAKQKWKLSKEELENLETRTVEACEKLIHKENGAYARAALNIGTIGRQLTDADDDELGDGDDDGIGVGDGRGGYGGSRRYSQSPEYGASSKFSSRPRSRSRRRPASRSRSRSRGRYSQPTQYEASPRFRSRSRSRSRGRPASRSRSRSRGREEEVGNPGNTLYVSGLSTRVTTEKLERHFSKAGKVANVEPRSVISRGFAFIRMETLEDANRCIDCLNQSVLEGQRITVEMERRKRVRANTRDTGYRGDRGDRGGDRGRYHVGSRRDDYRYWKPRSRSPPQGGRDYSPPPRRPRSPYRGGGRDYSPHRH